MAISLAAATAPASAAVLDGTCIASITLTFSPPATQPLPHTPGPASTSTGTGTITTGRFTGDQITIANLRDPLALITCLTTGLAQASGTTSLTFTPNRCRRVSDPRGSSRRSPRPSRGL